MKHSIVTKIAAVALLAVCGAAFAAPGQPYAAKLVLMDGTALAGQMAWRPVDKVYRFIQKGENGSTTERQISPDNIQSMQVAPPAGWAEMQKQARTNPDGVVAKLKQIAADYQMMEYDARAGAFLGQLLMRAGRVDQALAEMDKVRTSNQRAAYDSVMAPVYWSALIEANKTDRLESLLEKGATARDRKVAGMACIRRGDMLLAAGRTKDALKDGFLRAALLFNDQIEVSAEGLYKSAEAFDKLRQGANADKMRSALSASRYRETSWAKKLNK